MSTVNLPGFTAEQSLQQASGRYRVAGAGHGTQLDAAVVQPAAAIYVGGRFVCYGEVTPEGFIDCYPPSGPSEPPDLVCGPCIRGRQRCGIPGVGFTSVPCFD